MTPVRGEVWQVDLGLAARVRPCLVINIPFGENERALFAVVPHTTSIWNTRFEVATDLRWLESGVFDAEGIRPVPRRVFIRRLGAIPSEILLRIESVTRLWLGL